jgi:hypothetical protein
MSWFRIPQIALVLVYAFAGGTQADELSATVTFSKGEIEIITAYYREAPAAQYAGHAHKLPRGIAKKLARGKPLPPGIAKQSLPAGLVAQLPPPPEGHERLIVAGKILLVEIATQAIRDVLNEALLR